MSIIDYLLAIIAPHTCLGCGAEGSLLCATCLAETGCFRLQQICYKCGDIRSESTCMSCAETLPTWSASRYTGLSKKIIWKLKSGGTQSAAGVMARLMASATLLRPRAVLVPIPTASSRVRARGYDQAVLLAQALARETGLPCQRLLMRQNQMHQVGADRAHRYLQLVDAFRAKHSLNLKGRHIILVDDVLTTGATAEAAAKALASFEPASISLVTFAQAAKHR